MVKLILEREDIEKLIKDKYNVLEINGLPEDLEVSVKVEEFTTIKKPVARPKPPVLTSDGNIDANASGLTLENTGTTKPGGPMKKERGHLPVF